MYKIYNQLPCSDYKDLNSLLNRGLINESKATEIIITVTNELLNMAVDQEGSIDIDQLIKILCRIATDSNSKIRDIGTKGLFPLLVERLSDAFNPKLGKIYNIAFSKVINFCRKHPEGKLIDEELSRFGINTEQDMVDRKERNIKQNNIIKKDIRKCIIFSRVTLGAEIAINSIVIQKLREIFPKAELILFSDTKMDCIFLGMQDVKICKYIYPQKGDIFERLNGWIDLLKLIKLNKGNLDYSELLIIDPDSRFTQLGLLPVLNNEKQYLFFDTKESLQSEVGRISDLINDKMRSFFGGKKFIPSIQIKKLSIEYAKTVKCRLTRNHNKLVAINLGVGGNDKKRISYNSELFIIEELLSVENVSILLFRGIGRYELKRTAALIEDLRKINRKATEISNNTIETIPNKKDAKFIAWKGCLSEYVALIAESDIHIGYDSSGQHIAAACSVQTIDIFVDETTPMTAEIWLPKGANDNSVKIIKAYEEDHNENLNLNIIKIAKRLLKNCV